MLGSEIHSATVSGKIARVALVDEPKIRVILLDIEGTTTPAKFVYETLFPYAARTLESFLREHFQEAEIESVVRDLQTQHQLDERDGLQPPAWTEQGGELGLRSAIAYGTWLMARDSKCTPLKALQGRIWQAGYANGELRGEVYPDVPRALERWRRQARKICIYSSGSVLAQRLLFSTTTYGDLTAFMAGFFDKRVGAKTARESYGRIAAEVGRAAEEFLFISDAGKEIEAARAAGMTAMLCIRERSAGDGRSGEGVIHSFDEIFPDSN